MKTPNEIAGEIVALQTGASIQEYAILGALEVQLHVAQMFVGEAGRQDIFEGTPQCRYFRKRVQQIQNDIINLIGVSEHAPPDKCGKAKTLPRKTSECQQERAARSICANGRVRGI